MRMTRILNICLIILFAFFFVGQAETCSCIGSEALQKDVDDSSAVFIGRVMSIVPRHNHFTRLIHELLDRPYDPELYEVIVELEIIESFKGVIGRKTTQVMTPDPTVCCICGYDFQRKHDYLVFASGPRLETSICHRTQPVADALADLKELRSGKIKY